MRNEFLTIGQRVRYLMEYHGITSAPDLARAMYEKGILQYPENMLSREGKPLTEKNCHQYIARTINNHLLNETDVKADWIKNYCDFFGCSADFLLGYIPLPTHELSDASDQTGLSQRAIEKLQEWNTEKGNQRESWAQYISEMISHEKTPDLMKEVSFYFGDKKIEGMDLRVNKLTDTDRKNIHDSEVAHISYITHIATNILESLGKRVLIHHLFNDSTNSDVSEKL